ncbi:MAG TPA: tetratricopeptide repeat protein [Acetivibrio clariflavus]|nr:tetratricopeptide repeat protein [Acetivibrio clariflavus]
MIIKIHKIKGLAYEKKGMLDEALMTLDKSLELKPDSEEVKFERMRVARKIAIRKIGLIGGIFLIVAVIAIVITLVLVKRRKKQTRSEDLYKGLV